MLNLITFIAGIIAVSLLPSLPTISPWWALLCLPLLLHRFTRPLACLLLGLGWGVVAGQQLLDSQLDPDLEGEEILISGHVIDLPQQRERGQRFLFQVDSAFVPSEQNSQAQTEIDFSARKVLLTRYEREGIAVGQHWQLLVKLRKPRALVNEGGFDYQRWLLSRGIGATGYVRESSLNRALIPTRNFPVQQLRASIRAWILSKADPVLRGPLLALAIGDNADINEEQWQLFRRSGTGHLMAISGLHIGLVALFGFFIGRAVATSVATINLPFNTAAILPAFFSCGLALAYAALAGFALPTQRALVMVLLLNAALLFQRGHQPLRALALAAAMVLILDPLAAWDMGFWLSFGAVTVLLIYFLPRHRANKARLPRLQKMGGFVVAQGVVFLGLLLPLLAFNTPLSLQAPLANLWAIPLVSFFVVIPLLIGILLQFFGAGNLFLQFAEVGLRVSFGGLQQLQLLFENLLPIPSQWAPASELTWLIPFILLATAVLLSARTLPGRPLAALCFLPLLWPTAPKPPSLRMDVLDVGQGLAVVLQTPEHVLLYDTGAKFSERFNTGEAVVLANLRQRGIQHLDKVIVSHGDNDHAGGLAVILDQIPVGELVSGEVIPGIGRDQSQCLRDRQWRWGDVDFRLIEPKFDGRNNNNNLSCILLVSFRDQHILLPGDIEAPVERSLIRHWQLPQPIQTLIAPHHGSRTSSTQIFLEYLQVRRVVFSAAYLSQYGHPHPLVTQRYQDQGATLYNTADSGQLTFRWRDNGALDIEQRRQSAQRYWY